MWLGSCFPGDDDKVLMRVQFDAYHEVLGRLFSAARDAALTAPDKRQHGIDMPLLAQALKIETFDHRVLQDGHDLIAAYYRFLFSRFIAPRFSEDIERHKAFLREWWLVYAGHEIRALSSDSAFAAAVLRAVVHANTEEGYQAEDQLRQILEARYASVLEPLAVRMARLQS